MSLFLQYSLSDIGDVIFKIFYCKGAQSFRKVRKHKIFVFKSIVLLLKFTSLPLYSFFSI